MFRRTKISAAASGMALPLDALGQQHAARTEQHREHRPHLALEQQPLKGDDGVIELGMPADESRLGHSHRNVVQRLWTREMVDIQDEDAQQRKAAQHVHRQQALILADRAWGVIAALCGKRHGAIGGG